MTTPTLRRLDDRERYWGLTWPGWVSMLAGCGALYLAVRFSPLATKPTVTIAVIVLTFVGMVVHGVSGQALSPGRQLWAIYRYHRSPKLLALSDRPDRRGLVLDAAPVDVNQGADDLDHRVQLSSFEELSELDELDHADPLGDHVHSSGDGDEDHANDDVVWSDL
jgi:hypothetical protein